MKVARKNISLQRKTHEIRTKDTDMANILTSSIGKKLIMSISGLFLIIFLLLHGSINFLAVIDVCTGDFGAEDGLFQIGCNIMALPIVTAIVPILALGFIIHIIYACYLTWCNIKSRGGYARYEVSSKAKTESWASKNMFALGIIVLGFIAFHLTHFWAHMQLPEVTGIGTLENPYDLLLSTFKPWWMTVLYLVWFGAIWFHLSHGFWSAFQTLGWSNMIWVKRLNVIGYIFATLIFLMFATVAITCCVYANCPCCA